MLTVKEIEDMYGYCSKTKTLTAEGLRKLGIVEKAVEQTDKAQQPKKLRSIEHLESGCVLYTCDFPASTRKNAPTSWSI